MQAQPQERTQQLHNLLNHERNVARARVQEYRAAQEGEALPPPSDELDTAHALADVETRASLIERAEERLRAMDCALNLLEPGRYGICTECGDEIPLERIKALPFAAYCGIVSISGITLATWAKGEWTNPSLTIGAPEVIAESTEKSHDEFVAILEEGLEQEEPDLNAFEPLGKTGRRGRPRGSRKRRQVS